MINRSPRTHSGPPTFKSATCLDPQQPPPLDARRRAFGHVGACVRQFSSNGASAARTCYVVRVVALSSLTRTPSWSRSAGDRSTIGKTSLARSRPIECCSYGRRNHDSEEYPIKHLMIHVGNSLVCSVPINIGMSQEFRSSRYHSGRGANSIVSGAKRGLIGRGSQLTSSQPTSSDEYVSAGSGPR